MSFQLEQALERLQALELQVGQWTPEQAQAWRETRELDAAIQRAAWSEVLASLRAEPVAAGRLKALATRPLIYAVWRRLGLIKASLDERIEAALRGVRPLLHAHGGDVEVIEIRPPDTVLLRMVGACEGCPASAITLTAGVVRAIREACPEIRQVRDLTAGTLQAGAAPVQSPFAAAAE